MRSALAALLAGALLLSVAGGAAAHTPIVSLTCQDGLRVTLTEYNSNDGGVNTVAVWIDDIEVAGSPFTFGSSFDQAWPVQPPTSAHTAKVAVHAWDDPTGSKGWTNTFDTSIPACQEPTPTPTPETEETPTPAVTPSASPTPTGTVEAETGRPRVTPPSTDAVSGSGGGPGSGLTLVLALLAGASIALLAAPAARHRTR